MALEVERKWLVAVVPERALAGARSSQRIDQGYLTIGDGGAETRIRSRGGEYVLTVKSGTGLIRHETSVDLSRAQFDVLWPATAGQRVEKARHLIDLDDTPGLTIELDVYEGDLAGLIVAEVEFESAAAAAEFEPPAWFGTDVTDDPRYKNYALAVAGAVPGN